MKCSGQSIGITFLLLLMMFIGGCSSDNNPITAQASSPASKEKEGTSPLQSSEIQKVSFQSESLDQVMKLNVYLPKGYSPEQRYPVLYLIHGYGGNETDLLSGLEVDQNADRLIEAGKIEPLIMVFPQMDNSYGLNTSLNYAVDYPGDPMTTYSGMYEDYLYKDVVGYVDQHFSTITSRDGRFIGGVSMGGFISLHTTFLHTDLFSKVGGHSPALFQDDWSQAGGENGVKRFLYPTDEDRQTRDPLIFAEDLDLSELEVYLDCGDQDHYKFYDGAEQLTKLLESKKVSVQYHLGQGAHEAEYWKSNLDNYLLFYAGK
ncbi:MULTISPECIES: alpha/beta hydrolase [Paenibacillus]|nr:alpha/beta hydrolase-fold protein [Paenibacillus borealis]